MKTRQDQYQEFHLWIVELLRYAKLMNIPIRFGEAYRTPEQAIAMAKTGKGIINSLHCYSLAVDIWITCKSGWDIKWSAPEYQVLGEFWEGMGGKWGGRFKKYADVYHFEYKEKPLK